MTGRLRPDGLQSTEGLHAAVLELAVTAGRAIMDIYAAAHDDALATSATRLADKSDGSPLTQADLAAHTILCQGLAALTPHIPVVSEEDAQADYQPHAGCFWLLDPLDGTKEFLAFNGEFTVNVALIDAGTPRFGVVYAPALDTLYWGGRALGAFRRQQSAVQALRVAAPPGPGQVVRMVASKSHLNAETSRFIGGFSPVELVQAGSSLKFCRVAEGSADIYPRLAPTCEWDTAAAQAVLEGAGGYVYDTQGQPLRYGKAAVLNPSFIAASMPYANLAFTP